MTRDSRPGPIEPFEPFAPIAAVADRHAPVHPAAVAAVVSTGRHAAIEREFFDRANRTPSDPEPPLVLPTSGKGTLLQVGGFALLALIYALLLMR